MFISLRCRDFVVVCDKFWNDNYFFKVERLQQFFTIEKALAGRKKSLHGPDVVQACCRRM